MNARAVFGLLAVAVAGHLFAANPTIRWQFATGTSDPITKRFAPLNTYYDYIRAVGEDTDNNIAAVRVWKNGTPFAFNGGSGFSITSDPNGNYDTSPAVHIFSAEAEDTNGNLSPKIYWIVKAGGTASVGFTDLPIVNSSSAERLFLNTGNRVANAANLSEVIASLQGTNGGTGGHTLWFDSGQYDIDVSVGRHTATQAELNNAQNNAHEASKIVNGIYNPGQFDAFVNVHNFKLRGSTSGTTTLNWASWDQTGALNPGVVRFLAFQRQCRVIEVRDITFDTPYTTRCGQPGSHLIVGNEHITVEDCVFKDGPNWSVLIGPDWDSSNTEPAYVHFNENHFLNPLGDGIHVLAGDEIYLVGNYFFNTGDDSIALYNDGYGINGDERKPSNVNILANIIEDSHWRGIFVGTSDTVEIWDNVIDGTARFGIEVIPNDLESNNNYTPATYWHEYPNMVIIRENSISNTGTIPEHAGTTIFDDDSHGIRVATTWNLQIMDNTLNYTYGYGVHVANSAEVGIGNGNSVSNYGTLVGALGSHPGYLENITGSTYSVAPGSWKWVNAWGTSN